MITNQPTTPPASDSIDLTHTYRHHRLSATENDPETGLNATYLDTPQFFYRRVRKRPTSINTRQKIIYPR